MADSDKPLAGSVAIVTGASSGIGAAVAKHLAEAGAMVAMAARRVDKLNEIQESIEKGGGVAIAVKTDVCNKDEVKALVKHTESTLGPVDIIVNNAGVMYYTLMKNLNEDQWERTIDVNCKGVVNGVGAVLSGMISRGKGHIVNMSSNAGRRAFPGLAVYSGTKFFVEAMSSALRQELIGTGVKVTTIQPGDVKTDLAAENTDKEAIEKYDMSSTYDTLQAADIGRAVVYAVSQPPYVGVNEILIEPREGPAV
uniref:NADP-dependent 3-hydroxy acid dehydrogenase YdfG n=1 Tax=Saccoglossus kowalevskii TaxID=10224 RepID=A0ABM0H087_SACKO|nr:PREDICTED: dehydrogenase/reductase SDR family member 11-like [Saccoglossus kowalevskii]